MSIGLSPIQTSYAGCYFRSRLEARWAVAFDTLSISWQYEPEGFELPAGRYLPDFFLPGVRARRGNAGVWVEIKPDNAEEDARWADLVAATGISLIIAHDIPRTNRGLHVDGHMEIYEAGGGWDRDMVFCDCPINGKRISVQYGPEGNYHDGDHEPILAAFGAASSARFEYGETPQ